MSVSFVFARLNSSDEVITHTDVKAVWTLDSKLNHCKHTSLAVLGT